MKIYHAARYARNDSVHYSVHPTEQSRDHWLQVMQIIFGQTERSASAEGTVEAESVPEALQKVQEGDWTVRYLIRHEANPT